MITLPHVSPVAILVGTLLGFVLGALWYGPVFGKAWMAENGFTAETIKADFNPLKLYGSTFVLGLLASYVFGLAVGPDPDLLYAVGAGLAAGVFWIGTSFATSYLFEKKSLRHFLINAGYHALQFGLIGLAFGLFG
ncbi:MAG TPA: DUF1761 domain-containing protein [Gemmatimonadales bacterium]|nr:DUF1761 domain-containing protein [Gemmatimonadales bacterium]